MEEVKIAAAEMTVVTLADFKQNLVYLSNELGMKSHNASEALTKLNSWLEWILNGNGTKEHNHYFFNTGFPSCVTELLKRSYPNGETGAAEANQYVKKLLTIIISQLPKDSMELYKMLPLIFNQSAPLYIYHGHKPDENDDDDECDICVGEKIEVEGIEGFVKSMSDFGTEMEVEFAKGGTRWMSCDDPSVKTFKKTTTTSTSDDKNKENDDNKSAEEPMEIDETVVDENDVVIVPPNPFIKAEEIPEVSSYYLENLTFFGENKGFDRLMERLSVFEDVEEDKNDDDESSKSPCSTASLSSEIMPSSPINPSFLLLAAEAFANMGRCLNPSLVSCFGKAFQEACCKITLNQSDKTLRNMDVALPTKLVASLKKFLKHSLTPMEIGERLEVFLVDMMWRMLTCPFFAQRLGAVSIGATLVRKALNGIKHPEGIRVLTTKKENVKSMTIPVDIARFMTAERLSDWLIEKRVIEDWVIGTDPRAVFVEKSVPLLKFLGSVDRLSSDVIDMVWDLMDITCHQDMRDAASLCLGRVCVSLKDNAFTHLLRKLQDRMKSYGSLDKIHHNVLIDLAKVPACEVSSELGSTIGVGCDARDLLWDCCCTSPNSKSDLTETSLKELCSILKLMPDASGSVERERFLMVSTLCVLRHHNVTPALAILESILKGFEGTNKPSTDDKDIPTVANKPEIEEASAAKPNDDEFIAPTPRELQILKLENENSIIDALLEDIRVIRRLAAESGAKSNDCKLPQSHFTYRQELDARLSALSFLHSNSSLCLAEETLKSLQGAFCCPLFAGELDVFFSWLQTVCDSMDTNCPIVDEALEEELFESCFGPSVLPLDCSNQAFSALRRWVIHLNQKDNNLIYVDSKTGKESKFHSGWNGFRLLKTEVKHLDYIWRLALMAEVESVAKSAKSMLTSFQTRLHDDLLKEDTDSRKRIRQQLVNDCIEKILELENSSPENCEENASEMKGKHQERCLAVLRHCLQTSNDEVDKRLVPHTRAVGEDLVKCKILNMYPDSKDCQKYVEFIMPHSDTLWDLRVKIAEMISTEEFAIEPKFIALRRSSFTMTSKMNAYTLSDVGGREGLSVTASKSEIAVNTIGKQFIKLVPIEDTHAEIMHSSQELYNLLFKLIGSDHCGNVADIAWDLLMDLPSHDGLVSLVNSYKNNDVNVDWSEWLDASNLGKLLYALQVIKFQCGIDKHDETGVKKESENNVSDEESTKEDEDLEVMKFRHWFSETGGLEKLVNNLTGELPMLGEEDLTEESHCKRACESVAACAGVVVRLLRHQYVQLKLKPLTADGDWTEDIGENIGHNVPQPTIADDVSEWLSKNWSSEITDKITQQTKEDETRSPNATSAASTPSSSSSSSDVVAETIGAEESDESGSTPSNESITSSSDAPNGVEYLNQGSPITRAFREKIFKSLPKNASSTVLSLINSIGRHTSEGEELQVVGLMTIYRLLSLWLLCSTASNGEQVIGQLPTLDIVIKELRDIVEDPSAINPACLALLAISKACPSLQEDLLSHYISLIPTNNGDNNIDDNKTLPMCDLYVLASELLTLKLHVDPKWSKLGKLFRVLCDWLQGVPQVEDSAEKPNEELGGILRLTRIIIQLADLPAICTTSSVTGDSSAEAYLRLDHLATLVMLRYLFVDNQDNEYGIEPVSTSPLCQSPLCISAAMRLLAEICQNNSSLAEITRNRWYSIYSNCDSVEDDEWRVSIDDMGRSASGYSGMVNPGCICYMNSLVQQLFMMPALRKEILSVPAPKLPVEESEKKECCIKESCDENCLGENSHDCSGHDHDHHHHDESEDEEDDALSELWANDSFFQLQRIFGYLSVSKRKAFEAIGFCSAFRGMDGMPINVCEQQDAQEFFSHLCSSIEESTKETSAKGLLNRSLAGKVCNIFTCSECGHTRERIDPFTSISLPVKHTGNLQSALDTITSGETISDYGCDSCGKKVDLQRRLCIDETSDHVVFHLKRFDFDYNTFERVKLHNKFEYPRTVDLYPFSKEGLDGCEMHDENNVDSDKESSSSSKYKYELVGVVMHSGSAMAGHYYSYIKERDPTSSKEGKWFEFNDSSVTPFDDTELEKKTFGGSEKKYEFSSLLGSYFEGLSSNTASAFMLVYKRIGSSGDGEEMDEVTSPLTSNHPIEAVIDEVEEDNVALELQRTMYSPSHHKFMLSLLQAQPDSANLEDLFAFFGYFQSHIARGEDVEDKDVYAFSNAIRRWISRHSTLFARPLLAAFEDKNEITMDLLIRCPNKAVRIAFSEILNDLLAYAVEDDRIKPGLCAVENEEVPTSPEIDFVNVDDIEVDIDIDIDAQESSDDDSNVENNNDNNNDDNDDVYGLCPKRKEYSCASSKFMSRLLSFETIDEAASHAKRFDEYWDVLYKFARLHPDCIQFLIADGVLARIIDLYLGIKSPLNKLFFPEGTSHARKRYSFRTTSFHANWNKMLEVAKMCTLSCYPPNGDDDTPIIHSGDSPIKHLDSISKKCVTQKPLFELVLQHNDNPKAISKMMCHLCWKWSDFNSGCEDVLLKGFEYSEYADAGRYIESIINYLHVSDGMTEDRVKGIFDGEGHPRSLFDILKMYREKFPMFCHHSIMDLTNWFSVTTIFRNDIDERFEEWSWWEGFLMQRITKIEDELRDILVKNAVEKRPATEINFLCNEDKCNYKLCGECYQKRLIEGTDNVMGHEHPLMPNQPKKSWRCSGCVEEMNKTEMSVILAGSPLDDQVTHQCAIQSQKTFVELLTSLNRESTGLASLDSLKSDVMIKNADQAASELQDSRCNANNNTSTTVTNDYGSGMSDEMIAMMLMYGDS